MKERLQHIIAQKNLSLSQFADSIGIQRSTLHHIINGRNNPSLDVVMKIHSTYPDIDLEWLITGNHSNMDNAPADAIQQELFPPENPIFQTDIEDNTEKRNLKRFPEAASEAQHISQSISYEKKITNIIVIYSDGTTESFSK